MTFSLCSVYFMVHSDSVQFVNFQQSVLDLISLYLVHGSQSFCFVSLQQLVSRLVLSVAFSSWFTIVLFCELAAISSKLIIFVLLTVV